MVCRASHRGLFPKPIWGGGGSEEKRKYPRKKQNLQFLTYHKAFFFILPTYVKVTITLEYNFNF